MKIVSTELRSGLVVAAVALLPLTEAAAQLPIWDPQTRTPPFSTSRVCLIPVPNNSPVQVVAGPRDSNNNPTGSFPLTVNCSDGNPSQTGTCLRWDYKFIYPAGINPSLVLLAVDSNVKVMSTVGGAVVTYPFSMSTVGLSTWDSSISWGNTSTEIGLRLTDNNSTYSASVLTSTTARVGTVTVGYKSGKLGGFCAIAGAHMPLPGDPLLSTATSSETNTLGCTLRWALSPDGCVTGVTVLSGVCQPASPPIGVIAGGATITASCGTELTVPGSTTTCRWNSLLRTYTCVTVP